jgi:hypothetical protein
MARSASAPIAFLILCGLASAQVGARRWAIYESEMQDPVDDPADAGEAAEFTFARLRYRSPRDGWSYSRWAIDSNKSERLFVEGVRRLTRIHARSIEEIVDVESEQIFDWPWLYAVSPGDWRLSESHIRRLRDYLDRGGFLMVDDFHGERDWRVFFEAAARMVPNGTVVELPGDAPIFQTLYDLSERSPVPGANVVHGPGYEKDGVVPHWRAIVDEKGRVKIAICFNMDLGDAWEFADSPDYPERFSSMAYRLGINYILYAMTH